MACCTPLTLLVSQTQGSDGGADASSGCYLLAVFRCGLAASERNVGVSILHEAFLRDAPAHVKFVGSTPAHHVCNIVFGDAGTGHHDNAPRCLAMQGGDGGGAFDNACP